jgi:hypothetical protein
MNADAFAVLEAIGRGSRVEAPDGERWVAAFKTIRWAVEGHHGPMLTPEGRRARDQMAIERRSLAEPGKRPERQARRAALG